MKTIGMIGGMSWESSAHYYRILNQEVRARLGGLHSARCVLHSLDFSAIAALQMAGDWAALTHEMVAAAQALERGGADCVLICTNTMHKMADEVAAAVRIPLLHIADVTGRAIAVAGLHKVALLGTIFTMEQGFYKERMRECFDLEVLVPDALAREAVNRIIYQELVRGEVLAHSREALRAVIADLVAAGAQAVVLGCTELMLIVDTEDSAVPLFNTTELHAQAAVDFACGVR